METQANTRREIQLIGPSNVFKGAVQHCNNLQLCPEASSLWLWSGSFSRQFPWNCKTIGAAIGLASSEVCSSLTPIHSGSPTGIHLQLISSQSPFCSKKTRLQTCSVVLTIAVIVQGSLIKVHSQKQSMPSTSKSVSIRECFTAD